MSEENNNMSVDQKDIDDNKVMAILAYIGILVLVPILAAKESPFARFHANQGLILFLLFIACSIIMVIPVIGWIVGMVGSLFGFVCFIMGIINAIGGKMKELPLIGKFRIIK